MNQAPELIELVSLYNGNIFGPGETVIASSMPEKNRSAWLNLLKKEYHLGDHSLWANWVRLSPGEHGVGVFRLEDQFIVTFLYKTLEGDTRDGGGFLYHWVVFTHEQMLQFAGNWAGLLDVIRRHHAQYETQFQYGKMVMLNPIQVRVAQLPMVRSLKISPDLAQTILATLFTDNTASVALVNVPQQERIHIAQSVINLLPPPLRGIMPFALSQVENGNKDLFLYFESTPYARYQVDWETGKQNLSANHILASRLIQEAQTGTLTAFHEVWSARLNMMLMPHETYNWREVIRLWAKWLELEQKWKVSLVEPSTLNNVFELLQSDVTVTPQTRYDWLHDSIIKILAHRDERIIMSFTDAVCTQIKRLDANFVATLQQQLLMVHTNFMEHLIRWVMRWMMILEPKADGSWRKLLHDLVLQHTSTIFANDDSKSHEAWFIFLDSQLGTLINSNDWKYILSIAMKAGHPNSSILIMRVMLAKLSTADIQDITQQRRTWVGMLPTEYALLLDPKTGFPDERVIQNLNTFDEAQIDKILQLQINQPSELLENPYVVGLLIEMTEKNPVSRMIYEQGLEWVGNRMKQRNNMDDNALFKMLSYHIKTNSPEAQTYYNLLTDSQFVSYLQFIGKNQRELQSIAIFTQHAHLPLRQFDLITAYMTHQIPPSAYTLEHIVSQLNQPDVMQRFVKNQRQLMYILRQVFATQLPQKTQLTMANWMIEQIEVLWQDNDIEASTAWLVIYHNYVLSNQQAGSIFHQTLTKHFTQLVKQSSVENLRAFMDEGRHRQQTDPDSLEKIRPQLNIASDLIRPVTTRELGDKIVNDHYLFAPLVNGVNELEIAVSQLNVVQNQLRKNEIDLFLLFEQLNKSNIQKYDITQLNTILNRVNELRDHLTELVSEFNKEDGRKGLMGWQNPEQVVNQLLRGENQHPPKSRLGIWLTVVRAYVARKR